MVDTYLLMYLCGYRAENSGIATLHAFHKVAFHMTWSALPKPDLATTAKALANGLVPDGKVEPPPSGHNTGCAIPP
jgi:hypothetical protein